MPESLKSKRDRLDRNGWMLWGVTFAVLIALTAAVPMLYLPLVRLTGIPDADAPFQLPQAYEALVALGGLVLIFCLYTALKHRELDRMRRAFEHEEHEKETVRARLSELSELFQVSTTLNLQLRLDDILEIIVRRVVSTLRAQQASVMIYNPESALLETRAAYGLESEFARHARKRIGEGVAGWVAERGEAVQLDSNQLSGAFAGHSKPNRNITSALSLPLRVGDRCVGVLNVNRINHNERFLDHHLEVLRIFAEHVGAVIDRAETFERLHLRTTELEADVRKLSEANRMKDVFLSTASHELKTPLTSVIGYAELLAENDALSGDQRADFLQRLRVEAGRLLSLIEDILDLSRLESGKMTLHRTPVTLNAVVRDAIETTASFAAKHGVVLEDSLGADLPGVEIDEVKMRQVIVNLLVNAVKFSESKDVVTVRTSRDQDGLRVEVSDTGPGIRPEDATHIFELFGQGVHENGKGRGGLGIGLHLVRRILELHGGHVGVNTRPGEGSTFWIHLPLNASSAPSAEPGDFAAAA